MTSEKIENEIIHKEIDLIQGCINRMANNSFLIKGWDISVVIALVALEKSIPQYILYATIISAWYIDAYFLNVEIKYRELYSWVIKVRPKGNTELLYDLNTKLERTGYIHYDKLVLKSMLSKTLIIFYTIQIIIVIASTNIR